MADEQGFTLIEVLVALTILVLALAGVYRSLGIGMRAASTVDRQEQAVDAAQTLLAELGRSRPLRSGVTQGDLASGQHWRLAIEPLATPGETAPPVKPSVKPFSVGLTIDRPDRRQVPLTVHTILLGADQ